MHGGSAVVRYLHYIYLTYVTHIEHEGNAKQLKGHYEIDRTVGIIYEKSINNNFMRKFILYTICRFTLLQGKVN